MAVDWGTSNLRAWGIAAEGDVLWEKTSPKGMGKLSRNEYPDALLEVLVGAAHEQSRQLDVVICGMAGAKQGWLEAPYLEAPTDLRGLLDGAVRPSVPGSHVAATILPGVCQRAGDDNVMRGEETQLLGLASLHPGFAGLVCMPGTHSKWAHLAGTRIEHFSTAMTGEMFEVLRLHSVLRHSLSGELNGPGRKDGFAAGAADGLERPEHLLGMLFRIRAGSLLSDRQPDWCAGYLSGLLIGTEIASNRHLIGDTPVPLIGSPVLCDLYQKVLGMIGIKGEPQDATQTVLAGLRAARSFAA
ncbi:2-dehydro-3-deoxygalactonokinase [Devosia submarina]|uniref:2-dehydro-3-deoxygalactonokinase n=1 Tax=Devosia submarina TaxID=1173082 RepID=UPI001FE7A825|nr:2-dehydro-3-deoxygalactonokinase [Devosia submarina]